ncbi:cupin domain-containing protein [Solibacillus sp. FSL R7-0668]|uniref:cupin domain-containing protein n=1 Tax=Solibacillus sp. FSL R7-0668 TaxID=2921688 RepID=UPI0030F54514
MNNPYYMNVHPNPYFSYVPMYNWGNNWGSDYWNMSNGASYTNPFSPYQNSQDMTYSPSLKDHGREPFVVNLNQAAKHNNNFRTAIWTGKHMQLTLMSINVGEDIGLENHPNVDQFIRIERGHGLVQMGKNKNNLNFVHIVGEDDAIIVPAGTWHNVINTGHTSLKLSTIYAPPNHPFGTVHRTKAEAEAAEG